jgi:hypothetical protein
MGCDIHVYFEKRTSSGWQVWPENPKPHKDWWWEQIEYDMLSTKSAHMICETTDDEEAETKIRQYLSSMSLDEAEERFGSHPRMIRDWNISHEVDGRDYGWFNLLAGVRGYEHTAIWQPRGAPDDMSKEVRAEVERYGDDGHSHSWLMVSEMLNCVSLKSHRQTKWLRKNIPNPDDVRMVFYFDN